MAPSKDKADPKELPNQPYVGLEHVEAHTMRLLGHGRGADVESTKSTFRKGDVLYGKLRPYLNKVAQPDFDGICSTDFLVFRESDHLDPDYLAQYLNQTWIADAATQASRGVQLPRINWEFLANLPVSFPPEKSEQRAIAHLLRNIRDRQSAARQHLVAAKRAVDEFRQPVIAAACSPRATASSDEWKTVPLGALLKTLDQGWSPQCLNRPKAEAAEWAVIKTTAIQALEFKAAENKALPTTLKSRPTLSIEPGDLLITRAGPRARVGISCLVRKCPPHLMLCDKAYRMRVDPSKVLDEYLELVLNTPQVLDVIESMKTGTSDSGMNLTQKGLLSMAVSLPRIEEQRRIVELTRNLLRQSGSIASAIRAANLALDHVVSSTLDKTFRGSRQTG